MISLRTISFILGLTLTCEIMAQDTLLVSPSTDDQHAKSQKVKRYTHEQMTEKMVADLKLDEKQTKKVGKLNKKYKTLIEGSQPVGMPNERPPMEQGNRPSGGGFGGGMPGGGMGGGMSGGMGGGMGGPGGMGGGMGGPSGMSGMGCGMGGPRGGRPSGGPGRTSEYDYDKQQTKYDKKLHKLLSDEQYEGYLKLKPLFASQRRIREFLMGSNAELPLPPNVQE